MTPAASNDTSSFFGQHTTDDVPRDQYGRYKLPDPRTGEPMDGWTRATTFAATIAEQYGLRIWKERQVVWGLSRRPDLITLASTISGPEDKKALGAIVDEAHIAAGTQAKANRGTAIHRACQASEQGRHHEVPDELRPHVANYFAKLAELGLQVLPNYVERTVIVDRYHVAGTLDNLVLCPDGKIRVLDKKTGSLDYADVEFAVQLATYAHADAMFDYATGRYEPMPEVATDYAIIMHIDPVTGKCEPQRVNIEWGWLWARTCAEVMDIRKVKHVITPYVPETVVPSTTFAPREQLAQQPGPDAYTAARNYPSVATVPAFNAGQFTADAAALGQVLGYPGAFNGSVDVHLRAGDPLVGNNSGTPVGIINAATATTDTSAFWLDEDDDAAGAEFNGAPLAQYGQPSTWPCARNEACVPTGSDGLHPDGTVCLFGNARPGPVPVVLGEEVRWDDTGTLRVLRDNQWVPGGELAKEPAAHTAQSPVDDTAQTGVVADDLGPRAGEEVSPDDDTVGKVMKAHKDKAAMQKLATEVMRSIGVKESDPDGIKLAQYKADLANAIVTLAYRRGVEVPGIGVPSGPGHPKTKGKGAAKKTTEDPAVAELAKETAAAVRAAVTSIQAQTSIEGLTKLHDYYANDTRVGWTPEMQVAARTRAAELDAASGTEALSPDQMIDGATSMETLSKAYQLATNGGQNLSGWTAELDAKAQAKHGQLQSLAMSANSQ